MKLADIDRCAPTHHALQRGHGIRRQAYWNPALPEPGVAGPAALRARSIPVDISASVRQKRNFAQAPPEDSAVAGAAADRYGRMR